MYPERRVIVEAGHHHFTDDRQWRRDLENTRRSPPRVRSSVSRHTTSCAGAERPPRWWERRWRGILPDLATRSPTARRALATRSPRGIGVAHGRLGRWMATICDPELHAPRCTPFGEDQNKGVGSARDPHLRAGAQCRGIRCLRAAGLRVTEPRVAVYEALGALPHASADAVHAAGSERMPRASLQSVYNALGDFTDAGLVRRIEPAGHAMLFELRIGDNHPPSLGPARRAAPCKTSTAPSGMRRACTPPDAHGFTLTSAEVTYWGLCPACASVAA